MRASNQNRSVDQAARDAKKKKQQWIVVLLLIGLLFAILTQPKKDRDDLQVQTEAPALAITSAAIDSVSTQSESLDNPSWVKTKSLSRLSIQDVASEDLFPSKQQAALHQKAKPIEIKVMAIYGHADGTLSALVGDQIVRAGHVFPDGRRIVRISRQGIEVQVP